MEGPGGPSGPAVFAGAQQAPPTWGVTEVLPEVADDAAGETNPGADETPAREEGNSA
jgi:hypothetical protein